MRGNELLDMMELVNPEYIEAADQMSGRRKKRWIRWASLAACFSLAFIAIYSLLPGNQPNTIQRWSKGYSSDEYFKYGQHSKDDSYNSKLSLDSASFPYDETRYFSDQRSRFETEGIIPIIDTHPLFNFIVNYNNDASVYSIEIVWYRRDLNGGLENYSDLKVLAGIEEVEIINDCITIEMDEEGNILEPAVTVTERDGINIIARGSEKREKTLTFQNDNGWYQISGSWNDDYEPVVALLDWFWTHPIDFDQFIMDEGDNYTHTSLDESPDAFRDYLPDFSSFGFIEENTTVSLKNGVPESFEGHYVAHVPEDKVKNHEYYDVEGFTTMHWCITRNPDVYDLEGNLGDINDLTKEQVISILENGENKIKFIQERHLVIIYPKDPQELWLLIESLQG